jgi:hypothetical protein
MTTEDSMSTAKSVISEPPAIGSLIINRLRVLNLPREHLLRRAGYKNIAKGLRRLDELLAGELGKTRDLIRALPAALDVPPEVVDRAIEEIRRRTTEAQEAAEQARQTLWHAAFRPHAIILTERTVPQPIFVAAFIGIERLLRIDFDFASVRVTYAKQAVSGIRQKLAEFSSGTRRISETLPAFGRPIGVIVNYTPDRAIRFDLDGNALEILPHAHRLADLYIVLHRRPLRPAMLRAITPRAALAAQRAWSNKRYLNIEPLKDQQMIGAITA